MPQLTRRTLLQSSAAMAAPLVPAPGGPGISRNLLTKVWPVDRVAKVLIPRERFQPFPAAGERDAWEALPGDARAALVHSLRVSRERLGCQFGSAFMLSTPELLDYDGCICLVGRLAQFRLGLQWCLLGDDGGNIPRLAPRRAMATAEDHDPQLEL